MIICQACRVGKSGQRSAVSRELKAHAARTALWHRLEACDFTEIKPMLICFISY
ncbi:MAG: hypothetical protein F6J98_06360 [Moorea sp. SIO4G2]|nr:hypothetical protein [Moorena sp. SIO4G2]